MSGLTVSLGSAAAVLLLPLPFVHWVGDAASAAYIALLFALAVITRLIRGRIPTEALVLALAIGLYVAAVVVLNRVTAADWMDFSPNGHLKLTYQATSLFLVVLLMTLLPRLSLEQTHRLFRVYHAVFLATIVGEWVLVNLLGVSNALMPAYRASPSYYEAVEGYFRPFGLTGNASVNGSMLVVATWIMVLFVQPSRARIYLASTLAALVLNNSGQALLSFCVTCALHFAGRYRGLAKPFMLAVGSGLVAAVVYSGVVTKLSLDYIVNMNNYWILKVFGHMDPARVLLGGYAYYKDLFFDLDYNTEFYPVYAVSRFGLLLTAATWLYLWRKLPRQGRLVMFAALAVGSVHYATILYIPMLVPLAALLIGGPGGALASQQPAQAQVGRVVGQR